MLPNLLILTDRVRSACALAFLRFAFAAPAPASWQRAFSKTNLPNPNVPLQEIRSGDVTKDGISWIDALQLVRVGERADWLADREPVIGLSIDGDARAYPLRSFTRQEVVYNPVGATPVGLTLCPLCNAAIKCSRRPTRANG
ncbi:hypothetical protein CKO28_11780 [Rhodovibrio sodomensis]|uniref:DUF3179 domain-containing protein n=1 Tax=Rhodovibrio sodomensis TaxID=1088 RepID=A0ABS1DG53_9PROT|nr:DUF3179 domain-containing (seleno)protein [Rhodovibrio sodomensis]MBK1668708.1 hypothetical protein [Rhodovibrio sodomensis]